MDSDYVMSGSDDGNIRMWKAKAAGKTGPLSQREKTSLEYNESLRKRYAHMPEIRRISKHRHVPKEIMLAQRTKREMAESEKRKQENRRTHQKEGEVKFKSIRQKSIVAVEK